jgi:hypothetical protein
MKFTGTTPLTVDGILLQNETKIGNFGAFGLRLLHAKTSPERRLSGDVEREYIYNKAAHSQILAVAKESPISFDGELLSDRPLDYGTAQTASRALFNGTEHSIAEAPSSAFLRARLTAPEAFVASGNVYGWKCNFACDSPYAHKPPVTLDPTSEFTVDSDPDVYLFPHMAFTANGDIELSTSQETDRATVIYGANGRCAVDGRTGMFNGSGVFNWVFPRFKPGVCWFYITGDVSEISCTYYPFEFFSL